MDFSNKFDEKTVRSLKNKKIYLTSRIDIDFKKYNIIYNSYRKVKRIEYKTKNILKGHTSFVNCMLFYRPKEGKNYLISGGGLWDKTIKIWDISNFECVSTLKGHTDCIYSLISLNIILKNHFASGSRDHSIKIWDFTRRECVKTLLGHTGCN